MVEGEGLPPQITRGKVKPVYPTKRVALVACVFVPIPENIEFLAMGRVCCQIANSHLDEIPFVKGVGTEFFFQRCWACVRAFRTLCRPL